MPGSVTFKGGVVTKGSIEIEGPDIYFDGAGGDLKITFGAPPVFVENGLYQLTLKHQSGKETIYTKNNRVFFEDEWWPLTGYEGLKRKDSDERIVDVRFLAQLPADWWPR